MTQRPQRADRYEAQLQPDELVALHAALLDGKETLSKIRDGLPPWREGPNAGRPPSLATLSNIRDRLLMEASFQENEATTERLLAELKQEAPQITDDQLEAVGHRAFALLAIRQQDPRSWVALQATRNRAEIERLKLQLREREANRADEALALDRQRFQRETCELFLRWAEDKRAQQIAAGAATNSEKIEALGQLIFGEGWK